MNKIDLSDVQFAFVCSPFSGDVASNLVYAKDCAKLTLSMGYVPVAPHMYYPQFLDDNDEYERDLGLQLGRQAMLERCCCCLCFEDNGISEGMKGDIAFAQENNIPVKHVLISG